LARFTQRRVSERNPCDLLMTKNNSPLPDRIKTRKKTTKTRQVIRRRTRSYGSLELAWKHHGNMRRDRICHSILRTRGFSVLFQTTSDRLNDYRCSEIEILAAPRPWIRFSLRPLAHWGSCEISSCVSYGEDEFERYTYKCQSGAAITATPSEPTTAVRSSRAPSTRCSTSSATKPPG
jgi:hypothetical protein